MNAKDLNKAAQIFQKSSTPLVTCPRCGKKCYEFRAHPEAAKDLRKIDYDGSCCFPFPESE